MPVVVSGCRRRNAEMLLISEVQVMSIRKATYKVQWMKLDVVDIWMGWIRKSEMTIVRERMLLRERFDSCSQRLS
jgi:hypothetical protein